MVVLVIFNGLNFFLAKTKDKDAFDVIEIILVIKVCIIRAF